MWRAVRHLGPHPTHVVSRGTARTAAMSASGEAPVGAADASTKGAALVEVLSCVLARLVAANDQVRGWMGLWACSACSPWTEHAYCPCAVLAADVPVRVRGASVTLVQKLVGRRTTMTKFHALRPPEITVHAYLRRCVACVGATMLVCHTAQLTRCVFAPTGALVLLCSGSCNSQLVRQSASCWHWCTSIASSEATGLCSVP